MLGFGEDIGAIAPGRFADLVFLDLAHINYVPLRDALLQLVNGESTSKNFDQRPMGFRVWYVEGTRPFRHEFMTIDDQTAR